MIVRSDVSTVNVVTSPLASFAVVETRAQERLFAEINDDPSLSLVADRQVALIRRGPHRVELVFLNPEDHEPSHLQ